MPYYTLRYETILYSLLGTSLLDYTTLYCIVLYHTIDPRGAPRSHRSFQKRIRICLPDLRESLLRKLLVSSRGICVRLSQDLGTLGLLTCLRFRLKLKAARGLVLNSVLQCLGVIGLTGLCVCR